MDETNELHPYVKEAIKKLTKTSIELDPHLQDAIKKLWWLRFGCDEAKPTTLDYEMELNEIVYWYLSDFCAEAYRSDTYEEADVKELANALQKYEDSLD